MPHGYIASTLDNTPVQYNISKVITVNLFWKQQDLKFLIIITDCSYRLSLPTKTIVKTAAMEILG